MLSNASLKTDNSSSNDTTIIQAKMEQAIKDAIESYTGQKVAEMDANYYPDDYETCSKSCGRQYFTHLCEIDGDDSYASDVSDWNNSGGRSDAETIIVFQSKTEPNNVVLLRQVGTKNKHGVAYVSDAWLPENAFGKGIWNDEKKLFLLRSEYFDRNEDWAKFVNVRYADDDESVCEGCGQVESVECKPDCSYQAKQNEPKKGELSEHFCDEHPEHLLRHDGDGGHYCDDCDIYAHIDRLRTIATENGIKHSTWSFDDFEEPVRDFSKPHGFTASMVDSGCGHGSHCYGVSLHGNKPTKPVQLIGDTWLDVWKSIDRHIAQKKCGHRYIEIIEQKGDTLVVRCGS